MNSLPLTIGLNPSPYTQALFDGSVRPKDIDLDISDIMLAAIVIRRITIRVFLLQAHLQFGITRSSDFYRSEKFRSKVFFSTPYLGANFL